MFSKYIQIFNTVKFLKPKQIYYRLYYFGRARVRRAIGDTPLLSIPSQSTHIRLQESIHIADCYLGDKEFKFLNLSTKFEQNIDWNYSKHGKLWTYNLNYFDFLSQKNENLRSLIDDFVENSNKIKDGLEPFPISLRGINWIKYLSSHQIKEQKIDDSLYAQYYILLDNLEYHLLGNHLLENGFSLLFGAYYFEDNKLYTKAKEILIKELTEQILKDGSHFELSPMYHQIMLFRVLDCLNLVKNSKWKDKELLEFLKVKAELMLGWIESISYQNGDIPLLNDSANSIAPTTKQLIYYANKLELKSNKTPLSTSGYRKFTNDNYESIIDIGDIGADYIPGHAHADTFNFELRIKGKPFIVDTGLSTYETCPRRTLERSTISHNTVEINSKDQSEVWGGFRVANRAYIIDIKEKDDQVEATHNGYKKENIYHSRQWKFEENRVIIKDKINKKSNAIARLHFHPDITKKEILEHLSSSSKLEFGEYFYSPEFNTQQTAIVVSIKFVDDLNIIINTYATENSSKKNYH